MQTNGEADFEAVVRMARKWNRACSGNQRLTFDPGQVTVLARLGVGHVIMREQADQSCAQLAERYGGDAGNVISIAATHREDGPSHAFRMARKWSRACARGDRLTFDPDELATLARLGVGHLIMKELADHSRAECFERDGETEDHAPRRNAASIRPPSRPSAPTAGSARPSGTDALLRMMKASDVQRKADQLAGKEGRTPAGKRRQATPSTTATPPGQEFPPDIIERIVEALGIDPGAAKYLRRRNHKKFRETARKVMAGARRPSAPTKGDLEWVRAAGLPLDIFERVAKATGRPVADVRHNRTVNSERFEVVARHVVAGTYEQYLHDRETRCQQELDQARASGLPPDALVRVSEASRVPISDLRDMKRRDPRWFKRAAGQVMNGAQRPPKPSDGSPQPVA